MEVWVLTFRNELGDHLLAGVYADRDQMIGEIERVAAVIKSETRVDVYDRLVLAHIVPPPPDGQPLAAGRKFIVK